jgi:ABC-type nitrate/sulfonate/bicarbonate transport system permease component
LGTIEKPVVRSLGLKSFTKYRKVLLFALSASILCTIWEIMGQMKLLNPIFFAWPSTISRAFYLIVTDPSFLNHLSVSLFEASVGYTAAIIIAIPVGMLMGRVEIVENLLDPYISALNALPRIALMPLVILIFGIGLSSKVFLVFLGSFFPILINTFNGVKNIDPLLVDMAKIFGAKRWTLVGNVLIPSIMPYLLAGFRIGLSIAFIMVVVGEFFAATHGIGYMIAFEAGRYNTSAVMAWVLILSFMAIFFTEAIRYFERKKW